jgi:hypothetical protein
MTDVCSWFSVIPLTAIGHGVSRHSRVSVAFSVNGELYNKHRLFIILMNAAAVMNYREKTWQMKGIAAAAGVTSRSLQTAENELSYRLLLTSELSFGDQFEHIGLQKTVTPMQQHDHAQRRAHV